MQSGWKDLKSKYKFRRVLLVSATAFLILSIGWFAGRGVVQIGYANQNLEKDEMILGQSGESTSKPTRESPRKAADVDAPVSAPVKDIETRKQELHQEEFWELAVVSKSKPITKEYPVELERVSGDLYVDERIVVPLKQMVAQAKSDGINLEIVSAHESFDSFQEKKQEELDDLMTEGLSKEAARQEVEKSSLPVGQRDYHTGLAVDILSPDYIKGTPKESEFEKSNAYQWLTENSGEYGFILRFPKGKEDMTKSDFSPMHFRYVGKNAAAEIWEKEYCLEEYLFLKDRPSSKTQTDTFLVEFEESTLVKESENKEDIKAQNTTKKAPEAPVAPTPQPTAEAKSQGATPVPPKEVKDAEIPELTSELPETTETQKQPVFAEEKTEIKTSIQKEEPEEQKVRVVTNKDMSPKAKVQVEEESEEPDSPKTNEQGEKIDSPNMASLRQ